MLRNIYAGKFIAQYELYFILLDKIDMMYA